MKESVIALLIVVLVASIAAVFHFRGRRYEIQITQQQIDTALGERFPLTKRNLCLSASRIRSLWSNSFPVPIGSG